MTTVSSNIAAQAAYQSTCNYPGTADKNKQSTVNNTPPGAKSWSSEKTTEVSGPGTYGKPQLSEKGLEYYRALQKKYGNMNIILVSSDKKQEAEMLKGSFAGGGKLAVLIDTDKIEQMARDDQFRAKYEGILNQAGQGMSQLKTMIDKNGAGVRAFGMTVGKSGPASFFAVMDKSMTAQKQKSAAKAAEKAKAEKKEDRKAAEEKRKDKLEHKNKEQSGIRENSDDTVTITAGSVDELMRKIQDYYQQGMLQNVRTEEEEKIGSQFNFSV